MMMNEQIGPVQGQM